MAESATVDTGSCASMPSSASHFQPSMARGMTSRQITNLLQSKFDKAGARCVAAAASPRVVLSPPPPLPILWWSGYILILSKATQPSVGVPLPLAGVAALHPWPTYVTLPTQPRQPGDLS